MADLSLPSPTELEKAATNDPSSPDTQALLLRVLVYGTTAHESLSERAKASAKVLTDLWEDVPAIEDSLVDSLWLIGSSVLEEEDTTAAAAGEDDLPKDADMDVDDTAMTSNKSFAEIVKSLIQVPDRQSFWEKLQANLLPSILDASGLASETELLKKIKMQNTQAYYKQQKFSLLQEESEGYAKVLQFLMEASVTGAEDRRKQLMSIIGTFELDPSRVLDLSIDILQSKLYPIDSTGISSAQPETNEQVEWMLGTIKELPTTRIPSLLYFKLSPSSTTENSSSSSDNRLLNTAVFLAIQGLYDLQVLYADFFATTEESIEEVHSVYSSRERRRVQGLGRVSLSGTTKEDPKLVELNQQVKEKLEPLEASSSIRMLLTLLEWGYWERVKPLISKEAWSQLCRIFPNSFGAVLCDATMERIKPWCDAKLSHLPTLMNAPSFDDSPMETDAFDDLTLDEVVEAVSDTLTCTLKACSIGSRPKLFCQLCRLFSSLMGPEDSEYELSDDSYYFFKTILVPSISLFPSNSAVSSELWSVLERLPYVTRYRLYEDWKGPGLEKAGLSLSSTKPIGYVESEMIAGKDCRYALKRLSKENIRDMSRQLAKVTHSNPMVVFATILGQIESYDNMVEVMVEATRFVNPLGLDVLGYCILSRLSGMTGGVNRNRLKEDGVNVSQWLQSLEAFTGALYKQCPHVEFRGILSYLMRQLKEGNVMELGILRTLLKTAGGYGFADFSPAASLSATQLEGRAGSITLKQETMSFGIVEEVNYRASNKIRRVMQTDGFGVSMLMLISQVRSRILFETRGKPMPLKLMGNLYDSCQVVMSILLEFLTDVSDEEGNESDIARRAITQYAEYLPSLEELVSTYGFDVVSAWMLCRPLIRAAASSNRYEGNKVKTFALTKETRQAYQAMLQGGDESPKPTSYLFEFFYMNSLYDIFCPEELYATESSRVTKEIERLQQRKTTAPPASVQPGPISQKSDRDEVKRLEAVSRILASDSSKQKDHVSNTMQNMEAIRDDFFASDNVSKASANALLTHCVFPRCTQSPEDAIYCARFVFALHNLEAKGFSTLHYIDELIRVVSGALFGLTEGEAAHLAILLVETWKVVNKWRYDEEAFEKEVAGKPGGFMEDRSEEGEGSATAITYKDFEGHYNSWHSSLGASLIGCLKSKEYIHTRTGLLVLTRIVDVFPTRPKVAYKLQDALAPLQDEASARPDIRASASSYGMMLLRARDEGKWVEEDASVVKAREEKEKQVAEERKKKLAEQFQEMERETEKITQEIGPRDSHRNDRRRGRDSRGPPQNGHDEPRFRPPPPEMRATESGEVMGRDRRDRMDRRGSPLRDADRGRRDRAPARGSDRHDGGGGGGGGRRRDGPEDGGERWARGEPQGGGDSRGRGTKRSRPSTPDDRGEDAGRDMDRKRARVAQSSGGRDYDSRRDAGRGNSPGRRRSPPRTPPQSRPSGGRSTRRGRR